MTWLDINPDDYVPGQQWHSRDGGVTWSCQPELLPVIGEPRPWRTMTITKVDKRTGTIEVRVLEKRQETRNG